MREVQDVRLETRLFFMLHLVLWDGQRSDFTGCNKTTVDVVWRMNMDTENKMRVILNKRKKLNLNDDYGIQSSWDEIVQVLGENEGNTLKYLENCSAEDLYWISEVFEDLAEIIQSKELINCLRKLDEKFPELEMTNDIDIAESFIENP